MVKMEVLEKGLLDRCVRYLSVRWGVRKKKMSDIVCQIVVPDRAYQIRVAEKVCLIGVSDINVSHRCVRWVYQIMGSDSCIAVSDMVSQMAVSDRCVR